MIGEKIAESLYDGDRPAGSKSRKDGRLDKGENQALDSGFNGANLTAMVQAVLRKDPFTGTVFVFRAKRADRLKLLFWDGSGLVMAYERLEDTTFTWPAIKDGMMALNHAQFEALFAGLDWRKVKALETRPPAAAE
ncbi:hypothetical protein ROLI_048100 (plasmid) [Roseobacter fucihabitans]|uniref:Transposase n=1 Tax=Roseobacter fucihabitans TaxID=1537242 RepID=A0ABZ2C075_9RHOB|nr:IS66 Orf2 like protein [Roseobacter litoralis]